MASSDGNAYFGNEDNRWLVQVAHPGTVTASTSVFTADDDTAIINGFFGVPNSSELSYVQKVILPSNCVQVCRNAFFRCYNIKEIVLNEGLEYIGDNAFCNAPIENFYIPATVEYIGENAFDNAIDVLNNEIRLPSALQTMKENALPRISYITESGTLSRFIIDTSSPNVWYNIPTGDLFTAMWDWNQGQPTPSSPFSAIYVNENISNLSYLQYVNFIKEGLGSMVFPYSFYSGNNWIWEMALISSTDTDMSGYIKYVANPSFFEIVNGLYGD